jgi:uncharacterized protein (TIGR03435 family)
MRNSRAAGLTGWKKLLLATAGVVTIVAPVAIGVLNAPRLQAQSPPTAANNPTFEVASVKPTKSGAPLPFVRSPGRFTMRAPLRVLIQNAYQMLQDGQLVGGPSWLNSDRFDIIATASGNPPPDQIPVMLRALLADRFKLVIHRETRELPIYALGLARNDGQLGARMRPAAVDCPGTHERPKGPPPAPTQPGGRLSCGMRYGPGNIMAGGTSLAVLAERLAPFVNRVVIDQTGLAGNFDLDLEWTPDQWRTAQSPADAAQPPPITPDGVSLFTALREQLGLKLEATRGPVDVIVIDSVERPTPD